MTEDTLPHQTPFSIAEVAQRKARLARKRKLQRKLILRPNRAPPEKSPTQALGDLYEHRAWEAMRLANCRLLARQLRCPLGELDLIVQDGQVLVFVEVRFRSSARFGGALSSITPTKQNRLLRTVAWWLPALVRRHFAGHLPVCRIDVIAFEQEVLHWHRDVVRLSHDR